MKNSKSQKALYKDNLSFAKRFLSEILSPILREQLCALTHNFSLSLRSGDLILLSGSWYVTHAGLVRLAKRSHCSGIDVQPVSELSNQSTGRYTFRATVYKSNRSRGFVGYGDADPSNVSSLVRGAEMRVAETRAVNRALRKAYGVSASSIEEVGSFAGPAQASGSPQKLPPQPDNGNYGAPKVRDRLRELIRRHQLDPILVKAYAVDFCGTRTLREATREQVENFVQQLADWAEKDRNALVCQLNSYSDPKQEAVA
jgi:hypothetical protein